MTKLLFLSGSIRTGSFNEMLAKLATEMAAEQGADAEYVDLRDYDMPLYNGDWEEEHGLPEGTKRLKQQFIAADGFFIASPEYNSSITPLLKNTLDWISRPDGPNDKHMLQAYKGKVAALAGASPGGFGAMRALVPLRMLLGNIQVHVIPNQVAISQAHNKFNASGKLTDDQDHKMLEDVVSQFVETANKLAS